MDYPLMHPPFEMKKFREMNEKEATTHFEWFVSEVPKRLALLKELYVFTGGGESDLDDSPESLKTLWKWFLPYVKTVPKSPDEIEAELQTYPDWLKKSSPPSKERLSTEALALSNDIGIYFAEVFLRNNQGLRWGLVLKPKNDIDFHRPVVLGFGEMALNPRRVLEVSTNQVSKGDLDPDSLYELYHVWKEFIPNVPRET